MRCAQNRGISVREAGRCAGLRRGAQWQAVLPVSVKLLPASGTNFQS
jgi:hypothetical protein